MASIHNTLLQRALNWTVHIARPWSPRILPLNECPATLPHPTSSYIGLSITSKIWHPFIIRSFKGYWIELCTLFCPEVQGSLWTLLDIARFVASGLSSACRCAISAAMKSGTKITRAIIRFTLFVRVLGLLKRVRPSPSGFYFYKKKLNQLAYKCIKLTS